jgi:hypothetical protein
MNPLTVVEKGEPSDAEPDAGDGVPLVHVTLTETLAALFGTKSFATVNPATFSVFVIVQDPAVRGAEHVPEEL